MTKLARLKELRDMMQLLWQLFESVQQLPRGPEHTAAVQTLKQYERRLMELIQASETARAAIRDVTPSADISK
ncbi:hypothetical protein [Bradyrhizobium sp. 2S1]|nr:hypothetical protein [Bradyrhizobium sp. 2S1]MCK7667382.1 hypothetical protein [Bradyrhizobium sp. 2S1]